MYIIKIDKCIILIRDNKMNTINNNRQIEET